MTFKIKKYLLVAVLVASGFSPAVVYANYAQRADVKQFIDKMVDEHDFDRSFLEAQFSTAKRLDNVLESIARPAERTLTWKQYRPIFVTNKRVKKGKIFIEEYYDILHRAEKEFGVPVEIIAAIIGVESFYGRYTGRFTVFDSLTTLGFDYPPRSKFFKSELKHFLLLSREEDISIENMTGSYAGAMGLPQFISSSYRYYAVDFDGDGKRDLWNSMPDVIGSVANYFSEHGWQPGNSVLHSVIVKDKSIIKERNSRKPYITLKQLEAQGVALKKNAKNIGVDNTEKVTLLEVKGKQGYEHWVGLRNFYVITRYNHSVLYAMAVYQLSEKLRS